MAATVAPNPGPGPVPGGVPDPNSIPVIAAPDAAAGGASQHDGRPGSDDAGPKVPPQHQRVKLTDFSLVRTLGTGTFARVCLVRPAVGSDKDKEQVFALKILRKSEVIKLKQIDHVRDERRILSDVAGHPFITRLITTFSDYDSLYMLLDYIPGGELFSYLRRHRRFPEEWAQFYSAEIVLVLEFLHEHQGGVAYRDLKPENLLLDGHGHVKLVDFGFAKRLGSKDDRPVETYTLCGTPEYLAPEVIQNKGHTTAVDWWALGILIYEFVTGYPPFWHQNPIEIYKQIIEKPVLFPQEPPVSPNAQHIIRSFCTVDRSRRLGNISGGSQKVKSHPFFDGIDWQALYHRQVRPPIQPNVRYPGDAQCFDIYPEDDGKREPYTDSMMKQFDHLFESF
ncbi:camp-dependent protein kinase catalytic subunit [Xylaria venustula]|nr:camp-dependent protein kinase catalytic subunit [Xylaria venustula]